MDAARAVVRVAAGTNGADSAHAVDRLPVPGPGPAAPATERAGSHPGWRTRHTGRGAPHARGSSLFRTPTARYGVIRTTPPVSVPQGFGGAVVQTLLTLT